MKVKLFTLNTNILFYENYCQNVPTGCVFGNLSKFLKLLRRFCENYIPILSPLFYTTEFKNCGRFYDTIILFDSPLNVNAANYICAKYPNLRIIFWFWNHIYNKDILSKLNPHIERWTYDSKDAMDYNIRLNSQFYFPEIAEEYANSGCENEYDCMFVGSDKGRSEMISQCKTTLSSAGLSSYIHVTSKFGQRSSFIPYKSVVKIIESSRCIIDILPVAQSGMSLRPLEALFFNKKLITNWSLIKTQPFFNKANVFIIGEDNQEDLSLFVNSDIIPINEDVKEYYSFKNWINRFKK